MPEVWLHRWNVVSFVNQNKKYVVALKRDGSWGCSCPAWKFSKSPRPDCKHILKIKQVEPKQHDTVVQPSIIVQNLPNKMKSRIVLQVPQPYFVTQTRRTICMEDDI